jgi:hypothetical protein
MGTVLIRDNFYGTYNTFSGADCICTVNGIPIATLQSLTINVSREKAPLYVMGRPNPLAFSRGK